MMRKTDPVISNISNDIGDTVKRFESILAGQGQEGLAKLLQTWDNDRRVLRTFTLKQMQELVELLVTRIYSLEETR